MDSLGWHAKTGLKVGIRKTYEWYTKHRSMSEGED
jgi:dTDP-D-glucose 4,6-dehydratase